MYGAPAVSVACGYVTVRVLQVCLGKLDRVAVAGRRAVPCEVHRRACDLWYCGHDTGSPAAGVGCAVHCVASLGQVAYDAEPMGGGGLLYTEQLSLHARQSIHV